MKFVSTQELQSQTATVLRKVAKGEKIIVTKRGKPQAALIKLTEDDIEDVILTHPSLLQEIVTARQEYEDKGGITLEKARELLRLK